MKARSLLLILLLSLALGLQTAWGMEYLFPKGKAIFETEGTCVDCHRLNGQWLPGTFAALAGDHFVTQAARPVIATVLNGRKGQLGQMPAWKDKLDDNQIAAVVTYIRQAWSNKPTDFTRITPALVAEVRNRGK